MKYKGPAAHRAQFETWMAIAEAKLSKYFGKPVKFKGTLTYSQVYSSQSRKGPGGTWYYITRSDGSEASWWTTPRMNVTQVVGHPRGQWNPLAERCGPHECGHGLLFQLRVPVGERASNHHAILKAAGLGIGWQGA